MNKFRLISILLLIILTLSAFNIYAANNNPQIKYKKVKAGQDTYVIEKNPRFNNLKHPRVAIVLGGGGARGLVHIGVLKALEEANIPMDMIVGTSMGAIIGTMYGSGIPIDQIEEIATKATFFNMFSLNFPSTQSLLKTVEINHALERLAPTKRLENFPIPTALLSFDLNKGVKYVHTSGRIANTIQSSYAVPFYFPVQQKGKFSLVDPGVVELTPAKTAKVLGADLIISSTAIDELPYDNYNNSVRSLIRTIQLLQKRNSAPITKKYSDVIIRNKVGDYSFMDFQLANRLIQIGYKQAKQQLPKIKETLKENHVSLAKNSSNNRKPLNMTQILNDFKYNRLILDPFIVKPLFYFGKDNSVFKQNLFKDEFMDPQYGFEIKKGKLDVLLLNTKDRRSDLEAQVRIKKITPSLDLIAKSRMKTDQNDWELTLKHYAKNYTLSLGRTNRNQQNFNLIKNEYDLNRNNINFKGESTLLISPEFDNYKVLTSHQQLFKISSIWSLKPKIVFNNTNLLSSPTIYRGTEPTDTVEFQAAIDAIYTHNFLHSIEFMQIMQITDIGFYIFSDYQSSDTESTAFGIGSKMNLNLLGVKPIHLGVYTSRDRKTDESKVGWDLNFVF